MKRMRKKKETRRCKEEDRKEYKMRSWGEKERESE